MNFFDLSQPQKSIYYVAEIYPDISIHNIGGITKIHGKIDPLILKKSIISVISKNEGLRIQIDKSNINIRQIVSENIPDHIDFFDFTIYNNPTNSFNLWYTNTFQEVFNLYHNPLYYFATYKLSDNSFGYIIKLHHIIADGWSIQLICNQICTEYKKIITNKDDNNNKVNYSTYIENEKTYFSSKRFQKNRLFWNTMFQHFENNELLDISQSTIGNRIHFTINSNMCNLIKKYIQKLGISLNTLFSSAMFIYLKKFYDINEVCIGIPFINRLSKTEMEMVGMFTNTMPMLFSFENTIAIHSFITEFHKQMMNGIFNQRYPYNMLLEDITLPKDKTKDLYNICVNYYNTKLSNSIDDTYIENVELYNGHQLYSLQMTIKEWNDNIISIFFDYKLDLYNEKDVKLIYTRILYIIQQFIQNDNICINDIEILLENEKIQLINSYNNTSVTYPKKTPAIKLFENQCELTPYNKALSYNEITLDYKSLNEKANQLARMLPSSHKIIGIYTMHSIETIIAILAVLKSSNTYVPIDPDYPIDRIRYILKETQIDLLLVNEKLDIDLQWKNQVIRLDEIKYIGEKSNLELTATITDLAYIIFTSGSTGNPKGVMINNQGLTNYIVWAKKNYHISETDIFPLYSSLSFDLTITSIFVPLISGCQINIYRNNDYVLEEILKDNKSTIIKLTPSHMQLLLEHDCHNLNISRIISGGENLKTELAKNITDKFHGNIEIYNEYGPTETVVGCMTHLYDYKNDTALSVPIGKPADNVKIYVLDSNYKNVPIGAIGEIYISGDSIANGYFNNKNLTREKFLLNPYINGLMMYKTGDYGKFIANDKIEYIGRCDEQIKVNGYRIELSEIQAVIEEHPCIKSAVVLTMQHKQDSLYLCAYIIKKYSLHNNELKEFISKKLPHYMIPSFFIDIEHIPLTKNGKIDKDMLPKINFTTNIYEDIILPRNENEKLLYNVISEIFNLNNLSMKQHFSYLGGDSIKAIQISSRLRQNNIQLSVKDILENPLFEDMARHMNYINTDNIQQNIVDGYIKDTPILKWLKDKNKAFINSYSQQTIFHFNNNISVEQVQQMVHYLIKHHDMLRVNIDPKNNHLFYNNAYFEKTPYVEFADLSKKAENEKKYLTDLLMIKAASNFNVNDDNLVHTYLIKLQEKKFCLLIAIHHIAVDGVSWRILSDDIQTLYSQIVSAKRMKLPDKTISFKDWSNILFAKSKDFFDNEIDYWENITSKNYYTIPRNTLQMQEEIEGIEKTLTKENTKLLLENANNTYNTNLQELLIISLFWSIKNIWGNNNYIIELESHGRNNPFENISIERTVGWFTSMYPVTLSLNYISNQEDIISGKEQLRKIPNSGLGYGYLSYIYNKVTKIKDKMIRFNYLGCFENSNAREMLSSIQNQLLHSKNYHLTALIEINSLIIDNKMHIFMNYNSSEFAKDTIITFIEEYKKQINLIINFCCSRNEVFFTPSDFDMIDFTADELDSLFE